MQILHHLNDNGVLAGSFQELYEWYRQTLLEPQRYTSITASNAIGNSGRILNDKTFDLDETYDHSGRSKHRQRFALVTAVREPVTHYVSWYNYYKRPNNRMELQECLRLKRNDICPPNILAAEFGIKYATQLQQFFAFTDELRLFDIIVVC